MLSISLGISGKLDLLMSGDNYGEIMESITSSSIMISGLRAMAEKEPDQEKIDNAILQFERSFIDIWRDVLSKA